MCESEPFFKIISILVLTLALIYSSLGKNYFGQNGPKKSCIFHVLGLTGYQMEIRGIFLDVKDNLVFKWPQSEHAGRP